MSIPLISISYPFVRKTFDRSEETQSEKLGPFFYQLTTAPDLSDKVQLKSLDLSFNELTKPPDLSNNRLLEQLRLAYNRLNICPDVSNNSQLKYLALFNNQLTALHDSILSLPRECRVDVTNNQFTPEYIAEFKAHLEQHRALNPDQGPQVLFFSVYDYHANQNISLEDELKA